MIRSNKLGNWLSTGVLALGAFLMAAPFLLMLGTSLMTYQQTVAYPPEWWPHPATLENFTRALTATPLLRYFANSLFVALVSVAGQLATSALAGYAFARMRFKGRDGLFFAVLATMMVPVYINVVPLYALMSVLGWVDSFQALIVPALFDAFGIFLFRQ